MKLASMFITASAVYVRAQRKYEQQTSEKHEARFNVYHGECSLYSRAAQI